MKAQGKLYLQTAEHPINVNFKITDDGITPLMLACTSGNLEIVKLILANPTLVLDKRDNSGINSLYVSAYYGHFEVFKLLRRHGAKYHKSDKGSTILHVVCKKGFNEILKFLLHEPQDLRIPIDCVKNNGMTPAMLAVQKNHLFILRMLKESGADLSKTTEGGVNLLYLAA
jgi:ankyrin repeat protein